MQMGRKSKQSLNNSAMGMKYLFDRVVENYDSRKEEENSIQIHYFF